MKTFIAMLGDARGAPKRFWENYVFALLFAAFFAFVAAERSVWFIIGVGVVGAFGIFLAFLNAFMMGQIAAHEENLESWEEVQRMIQDAQQALRDLHRIEGPS